MCTLSQCEAAITNITFRFSIQLRPLSMKHFMYVNLKRCTVQTRVSSYITVHMCARTHTHTHAHTHTHTHTLTLTLTHTTSHTHSRTLHTHYTPHHHQGWRRVSHSTSVRSSLPPPSLPPPTPPATSADARTGCEESRGRRGQVTLGRQRTFTCSHLNRSKPL